MKLEELYYLFKIKGITDILIDGPKTIRIDRGNGIELVTNSNQFLKSKEDVLELALKLAALAKIRLDDSNPICDGILPNGERVNIILSPVAEMNKGAVISIRIPAKYILTLDELCASKTINFGQMKKLRECILNKKNIMIAGSTGSGKTTLLSSLILEIEKNERIVCIEEVREISENCHKGIVFLTAKVKNIENAGEVKLEELVKASMRMRPDRVIIGECRANEVREYINLLNTGHSGSISTIHANSAEEIIQRAAVLASNSGMDYEIAKQQLVQNLDVLVFMKRVGEFGKLNKSFSNKLTKLDRKIKTTLFPELRINSYSNSNLNLFESELASNEIMLIIAKLESGIGILEITSNIKIINYVIKLSLKTGISLKDILLSIQRVIEEISENESLIKSNYASQKFAANALKFLPLIGILLGYFFGANPIVFLTTTFFGLICLILALIFQIIGIKITNRLLKHANNFDDYNLEDDIRIKLQLLISLLKSGKNLKASLLDLGLIEDGFQFNFNQLKLANDFKFLKNYYLSGVSPVGIINAKIRENNLKSIEQIKIKTEELTVKLLFPLGLCFLPAFILLGVLPVIFAIFLRF